MEPMPIHPPLPAHLTGVEPIAGTDSTVLDFWSWANSDLRDNIMRSRLAEFLVAIALDALDEPRVEWREYDVLTPSRIKVEVKSSAYLQAWPQKQLSVILFSGLSSRTWSPETHYGPQRELHADIYVFAVVRARTHEEYNALDTAGWDFWVLPRSALQGLGMRSIGLTTVKRLAGDPVSFDELRARVESTVEAPSEEDLGMTEGHRANN